jgi:hypothetical protein
VTSIRIAATAIRCPVIHHGAVHKRNRRATAWASVVAGLVLGMLLTALDLRIAGGALAVLGLAPLFVSLDRHTTPGLFPGCASVAYLNHVLGYSIGPIGYLLTEGRLTGAVEEGFVLAQWGAVLGLMTFAVCYLAVFRFASRLSAPASNLAPPERVRRDWRGFGLVLLPISSLIVLYGFSSGINNRLSSAVDPSAVQSTLFSAFSGLPSIMFFFLGYAAAKRGTGRIVWLCTISVYSVAYFFDGTRGACAWAVVYSCSGMYMGGLRPRVFVAPLIAFTMVFVPLSNVLVAYRTNYAGANTLSERWSGLAESSHLFSQSRSQGDEKGVESFLYAITAHAVDRVFALTPESMPFVGLSGMENLRYVLVPRVVSPNRPDPDDPNGLAIEYGAAARGLKGSYFPTVGDGYRRFGWPGIALLYGWLAVIWAFCGAWAWNRRWQPQWMAFFVALIVMSPGIWSTTLPYSFYIVGWMFPKYFLVLWAATKLQTLIRRTKGRPPCAHCRPAMG